MTTVPKPNDPANAFICKYDAWNRLTEVREGGIVIAEYRYDAMNRRTVKLVPHSVEEETHWHRTDVYYNLGWQGLEERFADDVSDASRGNLATAVKVQWVWSLRYIDAPVCRDRDADGQSGNGLEERLFYATDANMNVTALVNTSGSVVERYLYDPYGKATFMDGSWSPRTPNASAYANEVLYCGYRYNPETGMYDVRYRPLDPPLGRWGRRDPAPYFVGLNLYEYVASQTPHAADPWGLAHFVFDWNAFASNPNQKVGIQTEAGFFTVGTIVWQNGQWYIKTYEGNLVSWSSAQDWMTGGGYGAPDDQRRAPNWNHFRDTGEWDLPGASKSTFCRDISELSNNDFVTCACGVLGVIDLASAHPFIEAADCTCNLLTLANLACSGRRSQAIVYAGLTAADCGSTALGKFIGRWVGTKVGAAVGAPGGPPGALAGTLIGGEAGEKAGEVALGRAIDVLTYALQNYITQGSVFPWQQIDACCRVAQKVPTLLPGAQTQ